MLARRAERRPGKASTPSRLRSGWGVEVEAEPLRPEGLRAALGEGEVEIERLAYWNRTQWVVSEVRPGTEDKVGQDAYLNSFVWPKDKPPQGARVINPPVRRPAEGGGEDEQT